MNLLKRIWWDIEHRATEREEIRVALLSQGVELV